LERSASPISLFSRSFACTWPKTPRAGGGGGGDADDARFVSRGFISAGTDVDSCCCRTAQQGDSTIVLLKMTLMANNIFQESVEYVLDARQKHYFNVLTAPWKLKLVGSLLRA
jgi:hypothetical protein